MATQALERIISTRALALEESALRDRYRGVFLGLAAGNALGLGVEGDSRGSIHRHFPKGVREIDPAERDRPWDDDLAQAVLLAEALLETEELDPAALGARFVRWGKENGRGMGSLTAAVLAELAKDPGGTQAARVTWERSGWSTAGNGAVMRCAPVALRWRSSPGRLIRAARTSALVTHYDARCEWSTVVVVIAVAVALSGREIDLEELATAVESVGGEGWTADGLREVAEAVRAAQEGSLAELELDDPMDMGYTLKTMQVALCCLGLERSFEDVLVEVVASGGDTDTNGAVAGAMLGARLGAEQIPSRWLDNVPGREHVTTLADALFDVSMQPPG